jgi:hypothetical protein
VQKTTASGAPHTTAKTGRRTKTSQKTMSPLVTVESHQGVKLPPRLVPHTWDLRPPGVEHLTARPPPISNGKSTEVCETVCERDEWPKPRSEATARLFFSLEGEPFGVKDKRLFTRSLQVQGVPRTQKSERRVSLLREGNLQPRPWGATSFRSGTSPTVLNVIYHASFDDTQRIYSYSSGIDSMIQASKDAPMSLAITVEWKPASVKALRQVAVVPLSNEAAAAETAGSLLPFPSVWLFESLACRSACTVARGCRPAEPPR